MCRIEGILLFDYSTLPSKYIFHLSFSYGSQNNPDLSAQLGCGYSTVTLEVPTDESGGNITISDSPNSNPNSNMSRSSGDNRDTRNSSGDKSDSKRTPGLSITGRQHVDPLASPRHVISPSDLGLRDTSDSPLTIIHGKKLFDSTVRPTWVEQDAEAVLVTSRLELNTGLDKSWKRAEMFSCALKQPVQVCNNIRL